MAKEKTERVIPMVCKKCGNKWDYKGKSKFYVTCSVCKTSIKLSDEYYGKEIKE